VLLSQVVAHDVYHHPGMLSLLPCYIHKLGKAFYSFLLILASVNTTTTIHLSPSNTITTTTYHHDHL
jgi:hypothetical protein